MNLKYKDFEEIAKSVKTKFEHYQDDDVEITVWLRQVEAINLMKSLAYTEGVYVGNDVIETMGGCQFSVNKVNFKIMVK